MKELLILVGLVAIGWGSVSLNNTLQAFDALKNDNQILNAKYEELTNDYEKLEIQYQSYREGNTAN